LRVELPFRPVNRSHSAIKHILPLAGILILTILVYAKLPPAYFCAYDDFLEVHRAAFEDTREPQRVFTTTHFTSYKYRPLNRGINLITYWVGSGSAMYFRTRNVLCHLLNVVFIYIFAWMLFRNRLISISGALLLGIHPLANHAVVGAVMTNSAAHSLLLFSLLAFLASTRQQRPIRFVWLCAALFAGWLSLLTYEAAISLYPLMFAYLGIQVLANRKWPVNRAYILTFVIGSAFFWFSYYLIHARYVPYSAKQAMPAITLMLKNLMTYIVAILLPIDPVLANTWFGIPLPSDIDLHSRTLTLFLGISGVIALLVVGFLLMRFRKNIQEAGLWPAQLFLLTAAAAAIAPLVVFTDKPSETYLYLTIAFVAVLFASIIVQLLKVETSANRRIVFAVMIGALSISFGLGTWVRNSKVYQCGQTAAQIVSGLNQSRFKSGSWYVWLIPAPGEPQSHRYGMYGWRGIDTVGQSAVQEALQLVNRNEEITARVLTPQEVAAVCNSAHYICMEVHADGSVEQVVSQSLAK